VTVAQAERVAAGRPPALSNERPSVSKDFVASHQRARVVGAVAELAHESGIDAITVSAVCSSARIARATFYSLFDGREACLGHAFASAYEQIFGLLERTEHESEGSWLHQLDRELEILFATIAAKPLLAELCLVHGPGSPAAAGQDTGAAIALLARMIAAGDSLPRTTPAPSPLVEEYVAGSLVSLVRLRTMQGAAAELPGYRDEMMLFVAIAKFGPEKGMSAWRDLSTGHEG
jgi:AcrR family transcriptional regulator